MSTPSACGRLYICGFGLTQLVQSYRVKGEPLTGGLRMIPHPRFIPFFGSGIAVLDIFGSEKLLVNGFMLFRG